MFNLAIENHLMKPRMLFIALIIIGANTNIFSYIHIQTRSTTRHETLIQCCLNVGKGR